MRGDLGALLRADARGALGRQRLRHPQPPRAEQHDAAGEQDDHREGERLHLTDRRQRAGDEHRADDHQRRADAPALRRRDPAAHHDDAGRDARSHGKRDLPAGARRRASPRLRARRHRGPRASSRPPRGPRRSDRPARRTPARSSRCRRARRARRRSRRAIVSTTNASRTYLTSMPKYRAMPAQTPASLLCSVSIAGMPAAVAMRPTLAPPREAADEQDQSQTPPSSAGNSASNVTSPARIQTPKATSTMPAASDAGEKFESAHRVASHPSFGDRRHRRRVTDDDDAAEADIGVQVQRAALPVPMSRRGRARDVERRRTGGRRARPRRRRCARRRRR